MFHSPSLFRLAFLAISLAYIYSHLEEHLPLDNPTWCTKPGFYYAGEFEKLASSLRSLSETLRGLEAKLKEYEVLMNLKAVPWKEK